jgi:glycosyltransferase involved in cell wall biosynthesis
MKILIDFRKYDGVIGGVERGVIEITRRVAGSGHQVIILPKISRLEEVRQALHDVPDVRFIALDVPSHAMSLANVYVDSVTLQDIAANERADVIHFPYNWSFPLRKRVPSLLTIHDVIPLTFREAMGLFRNRLLYRPGIRLACRLNDVIVTVSEFSRQDMGRKLGIPTEKIRVIPNGIREPFASDPELESQLAARWSLDKDFILYVGGIHERKNVPRLIQAFSRLVSASGFSGKLLVTGRVSGAPYQEKMRQLCEAAVRETGMQERVVFTGFITDRELDSLMRRAVFLAYPSLYEGFGIPVLEAMRLGIPVITSSTTALPEVAGDAALLVNPESVDEIWRAMARLLQDGSLRQVLVEKGRQRADPYTWERTSEQYLDLYRSLIPRRA